MSEAGKGPVRSLHRFECVLIRGFLLTGKDWHYSLKRLLALEPGRCFLPHEHACYAGEKSSLTDAMFSAYTALLFASVKFVDMKESSRRTHFPDPHTFNELLGRRHSRKKRNCFA